MKENDKLPHDYYKYIESELYNYKYMAKELEELQDDIVGSSPAQSGDRVQSSILSDETASKAFRLVTNVRLKRLQDTIRAIETGIRILKASPEQGKYRLLEMKYFECQYTDRRIAKELNISIETYYRWKRQIISLMAMHMGLV
jgi:RinA family phage transcriptional activator